MSPTSIASEPWRRPEFHPRADTPELPLGDLRFRALLSDRDWEALPAAVRRRFSTRLAAGETIVYVGRVVETRMSRLGWCLAQVVRLIGAPLPLARDRDVAAIVAVTEEMAGGGQVWTRVYARRGGFPQVIHSAKRFAGRTGLEEQVGGGVGMALTVHVVDAALVFRSAGYFVRILGGRFALPAWLSPGALTVTHAALAHVPANWVPVRRQEHAPNEETGARSDSAGTERAPADGAFTFTLDLCHPRFGALIRQTAVFREAVP